MHADFPCCLISVHVFFPPHPDELDCGADYEWVIQNEFPVTSPMSVPPGDQARTRAQIAGATGLVAISACGFGSIPVFVLLAASAGSTLLTTLTWRYALALVPLFVIAGGWRGFDSMSRQRGRRLLVIGGGGQATIAFVSLTALVYIPAATLSFLFYTYPAWVALLAAVRRTEPLTARRLAALALSLSGIVIMIGAPGSAELDPLGVGIALLSAIIYAVYLPTINALQRGVDPAAASVLIALGAGIILALLGVAAGQLKVALSAHAWLAITGFALVSTVIAFITLLRGMAVIGPVRTAIVSTVEPFWTALLSATILAQPLTTGTLAGGVLIATAVLLLQFPQRTRAQLPGTEPSP